MVEVLQMSPDGILSLRLQLERLNRVYLCVCVSEGDNEIEKRERGGLIIKLCKIAPYCVVAVPMSIFSLVAAGEQESVPKQGAISFQSSSYLTPCRIYS